MTAQFKRKMFDMEVFGFKNTGVNCEGYCPNQNIPFVPKLNDSYVFERNSLRDINNFMLCSFGDGLYLTGATGTGKTSVVEQYHARLNMPCISYTCGGSTEYQELVGQWCLVKGDTVWMDGPLTKAMRNGYTLILNEVDLVDPSELANLNGVLEGSPLVINQLGGEVVEAHESFRLVVTANSNGGGDTSGMYSGVMRQNLAFMDRFVVVQVDYMNPEVEVGILRKVTPDIPVVIAEKMVELANKVRKVFSGETIDDTQLSVTFSTRTLIRWAIQTQRNKGAACAISYALDRSLLNRCSDATEIEAINTWAQAIFGDTFKPESWN